jgi:hypothetical protein
VQVDVFLSRLEARELIWSRAILSALVAIAIAVAPIGVAWASSAAHRGAGTAGMQHHPEATREPVAGAMHDCASKMKNATKSHPPCCAKDLACPPEFCIAKCFQLVNAPLSSSGPVLLKAMRLSALDQAPLPDWPSRPQPPPPRT